MNTKLFALIVLSSLLLSACAAPASGSLAGTSWVLQSINGNRQVGAALGGQPVTLQFTSATEMGGSGGCNSYGGSYQAGDGRISFGGVMSTLMMCADEDVGAVETAFFAALGAIDSYAITECEACANPQTLTFTGGGHTLVFINP